MLLLEALKAQFHFHLLEQNLDPGVISLISAGLLKEEDSTQGVKLWTETWKIIDMQGRRLESHPEEGSFLPCHYFGNGWGNFWYSAFYLVYSNCPVSWEKTLVLQAAVLVLLEEHKGRKERGLQRPPMPLNLTETFSSFQPLTKPATSLWA